MKLNLRPLFSALSFTTATLVVSLSAQSAIAADVKITPLGSMEGEFCQLDRAMILQDPDGTRLLYDPGRTVAGADDKRLGKIDAVLVSHMHGDHVGDKHISDIGKGECKDTKFPVNALPNTSAASIAHAKGAKIITGSEMPKFFATKLKALGGDPKNSQLVRFGASTKVGGITITTVPAAHSNGISGHMIGGELGKMLDASGLTAYAGPPTGYVITFSNGLVTYLSGDTGITAEQETVVGDHYKAKLVVINIGDTFTTGPKEAAWVVNKLIKPESIIPSHANQPSTAGGKIIEGTRLALFKEQSEAAVHVPLSGRTMSFDGSGKCTEGCS
ncbi:MBL fold metallo-hydrolase [uncultured Cocleimonas sp.]|uniref:MBL fold metallo-hydrolase n=1 Tax=uncultured Cocleimonas sp. TaxID=1051587 RepID=UPI0026141A1C|nr:MBL fold metallo-hydrolase [uncultured Cocleimonas sp.]